MTFSSSFSTYPNATWSEGSAHGDWRVEPSGGQRVAVVNGGLELHTQHVGSGNETYASLVTSVPRFATWNKLTVTYKTLAQYRTPVANDWEVAWVLFNFENVNRFYSAILKPDGWEIAKEWLDGTGVQRQDFLGAAWNKQYPINHKYQMEITQVVTGPSIAFSLAAKDLTTNGPSVKLATVYDNGTRESGPAYLGGKVGLYTEDSKGRYYSVSVV